MTHKEKDDLVMLMDDSHLRKLAKLLRNQEESLMGAIKSESERAEYTDECNIAYNKVITLLDKCNNFNHKSKQHSDIAAEHGHGPMKHAINTVMELIRNWLLPKGFTGLVENLEYESGYAYDRFSKFWDKSDGVSHKQEIEKEIARIGNDIQDYVKYAINVSLQCIRNCRLRTRWVSKIEVHFETLVQELEEINSRKLLGENVSLYKQCMLDLARNCESGLDQFSSEAYTTLLQKKQIRFSDTVMRKMTELGFVEEVEVHPFYVEFVFGEEAKSIRDLTRSTFHGLCMPDGRALACHIAYANQ